MSLARHYDETLRSVASKVTGICLSREFDEFRQELESIYRLSGSDDVVASAFEDALFAMMAEDDSSNDGEVRT